MKQQPKYYTYKDPKIYFLILTKRLNAIPIKENKID